MATINLGKDFNIDGLEACSELTWTQSAEKLDITTRTGAKPYKQTRAGLVKHTFEGTVFADADTSFEIGSARTLTVNGTGYDVIVVNARRSEPKDGVVTYQVTMTPGYTSDNTAPV